MNCGSPATMMLGLLTRWEVGGSSQRMLWLLLCLVVVAVALLRAKQHLAGGQLLPAAIVMGCASLVVSPSRGPHHLVWTVMAGLWLVVHRRPALAVAGGVVLLVDSVFWQLLVRGAVPELVLDLETELLGLCCPRDLPGGPAPRGRAGSSAAGHQ